MNALLEDWNTPFEIPPFTKISDGDFTQAFETALEDARARFKVIVDNPAPANFANTIEAMERADELLGKVGAVFFNRAGTDTNDVIRAAQRELSPKLAAFGSEIMMDAALFARVNKLFENRDALGLSDEQRRVLELYHLGFVRAGANLTGPQRGRFKEIAQELARLGTAFSQNVQADEESWSLALDANDLEGLPDFVCSAARAAAKERGQEGYAITLSRSLIVPFLQFSKRRDLREVAFKAWVARGENGGETDNRENVREILHLRHERATLLGYDSFADFKLEPEMAKTPSAVKELLTRVWEPARIKAEEDAAALAELMAEDGVNDTLQPWDWRFYSAIRQKREHDLDETELKPYLQLDNMIEAAFDCATRLFGLSFKEIDAPVPHPDARIWEVRKGARHMGVFIGDYFNRSSKRSGAWCSGFRSQSKLDGDQRPIAINVCNFAKPDAGQPALLTFDDARTLFHEFGHALHVLLSDVTYEKISGTSVARDFVELPSQLYEHWLSVPEVLSKHALHAETGEAMPADLLQRLLAAETYDAGFATVEYVASALVDLAFHSAPPPADPMQLQIEILEGVNMPQAITMRHATPHFQHVFSGDGYSSGYYSYMWSEVMDADAFCAFEETGDVFNSDLAEKLANHIYSAGGSKPADELYKAFRGAMPDVQSLLVQRGLV